MTDQQVEPYTPVLLKLLREVVHSHDSYIWELLMRYRVAIETYFAKMGLVLTLVEEDGYAYLHQPRTDADGKANKLPRLTRSRSLNFNQTLLAVLLRERLDEHDQQFDSEDYLILSQYEVVEMMNAFLENLSDERRTVDKVQGYINQLIKLGLLREVGKGKGRYIVERVIKSRVTSDILQEIKQKLEQYTVEKYDESRT